MDTVMNVISLFVVANVVGAKLVPATRARSASMDMKLFMKETEMDGPRMSYPRNIPIGHNVFVDIRFTGTLTNDSDVRPMPIDCYHSTDSHAEERTEERIYLLRSACPFHDRSAILSRPSHGVYRMSYAQRDAETERPYIFLHCKVGVCSKRGDRLEEGIADCPPSDYCESTIQTTSPKFPSPDQRPLITYLSSGPMKPTYEKYDVYAENNNQIRQAEKDATIELDDRIDIKKAAEDAARYNRQQHAHALIVQGVETNVVIFIAIVSFAIGAILVAALWCINVTYSFNGTHKNIYANDKPNGRIVEQTETGQQYGVYYPPPPSSLPLLSMNAAAQPVRSA